MVDQDSVRVRACQESLSAEPVRTCGHVAAREDRRVGGCQIAQGVRRGAFRKIVKIVPLEGDLRV